MKQLPTDEIVEDLAKIGFITTLEEVKILAE